MAKNAVPNESLGNPVLVTTAHRGVFFGYSRESPETLISRGWGTLQRARNCVYWSTDTHGFVGLAESGPQRGCRVGPRATLSLNSITSVAEVSEEAAKRWEDAPWA